MIDLKIGKGKITALISGSEIYHANIQVDPILAKQWEALKKKCSGKVDSLLELLSGKLSKEVMTIITDQKKGLFPSPKEIHLSCSCPDSANLCKHLAGMLYGIGSRFDTHPELLFLLRSVNYEELIDTASLNVAIDQTITSGSTSSLSEDHLSDIFGIDLGGESRPKVI